MPLTPSTQAGLDLLVRWEALVKRLPSAEGVVSVSDIIKIEIEARREITCPRCRTRLSPTCPDCRMHRCGDRPHPWPEQEETPH